MLKFMANGRFMRKAMAFGAAVMITVCALPQQALAVEYASDTETGLTAKQETEKPSNPERKQGEKPILGEGETGVLIDTISGRVLFGIDENKRMFPASTTKIMTCLLAVEAIERGEASPDAQVEITAEMLDGLDPDGSNIELKEGEILSFQSLLYGIMIPSGNDAACAVAQYIANSKAAFADMMNTRAAELGATDTHFQNPSGLHDDNHYTTAADMAKIAREAMKHEKFRNIADIAHIKIEPTNLTEKERYYINTNGLLSKMRYTNYYYKGATGIKTGYTGKAGNCLVSSASSNGAELIGVIFGGKTAADSHKDSIEMLDWGFETFEIINVLSKGDMPFEVKVKHGKGSDSLPLSVLTPVTILAPKGTELSALDLKYNTPDSVYAPINYADNIGSVSVMLGGEEVGSGTLVAERAVARSAFWPVFAFGEWLWSKTAVRVIVYLLIAALAGFVLLFIIGLYRNIKRARRRPRRLR